MNAKQRKHTCTVNPTDSGLRAQVPRCASTYLVSHNWESENHPDNDEGTKLKWLQNIKAHLLPWIPIRGNATQRRKALKLCILPYVHRLPVCGEFLDHVVRCTSPM